MILEFVHSGEVTRLAYSRHILAMVTNTVEELKTTFIENYCCFLEVVTKQMFLTGIKTNISYHAEWTCSNVLLWFSQEESSVSCLARNCNKIPFYNSSKYKGTLKGAQIVHSNFNIVSGRREVCFGLLGTFYWKLSDIQLSLPTQCRHKAIFQNKPLTIVKDLEDCKPAHHKADDSGQDVNSDQYASLATLKMRSCVNKAISSAAKFVGCYQAQSKRSKSSSTNSPTWCFVCGRQRCRSTSVSLKKKALLLP